MSTHKTMLRTSLTLSSSILIALLCISVFISIDQFRRRQAVLQSAAVALEVAQIRSALSAYMAELGVYPQEQEVVLGTSQIRVLCLGTAPAQTSGFVSSLALCKGKVLLELNQQNSGDPMVYSSTGASYSIQFSLRESLGAYKITGAYCATERGVVVGEC